MASSVATKAIRGHGLAPVQCQPRGCVGDRWGLVHDLGARAVQVWHISTRIENVLPGEMQRRGQVYLKQQEAS